MSEAARARLRASAVSPCSADSSSLSTALHITFASRLSLGLSLSVPGEYQRARTEQSFCVPKAGIVAQDYGLSFNRYKGTVYDEAE